MTDNTALNQALQEQVLSRVGVGPDRLQEVSQILNEAALAHGVFMNFDFYKNAVKSLSGTAKGITNSIGGAGEGLSIPQGIKDLATPENLGKAIAAAKDPRAALKQTLSAAKTKAMEEADKMTGGAISEGRNALNNARSTAEDLVNEGNNVITNARNTASDIVSEGKSAISNARATANDLVNEGKTAIKNAVSDVRQTSASLIAEGNQALSNARASATAAVNEASASARNAANQATSSLRSVVEDPLSLSDNVANQIRSSTEPAFDLDRITQNYNVRMKLPAEMAFDSPDIATELPSLMTKSAVQRTSRVMTLLQKPSEITGASRGDSTLSRALAGQEPGLPKLQIGSRRVSSAASSVADEAVTTTDKTVSNAKSAVSSLGEDLTGTLSEIDTGLGIGGIYQGIKSRNKTQIGSSSGQVGANELKDVVKPTQESKSTIAEQNQSQADALRNEAQVNQETEMTTIKPATTEPAPGIQETSFPSNIENTTTKAASEAEKAGDAIQATEEAADPELSEGGPVGWAIEGALLLASIGTQIADLFKKKQHQQIVESGATVGV